MCIRDSFEYIVTDSELEALVLECNLIKEHTPKYNTMPVSYTHLCLVVLKSAIGAGICGF